FLFEVGFRWAMLNANAVGNRASFEVLGTVAVAFSPVRKLLIQLSASLSLLLDIAIKRILADKDIEFQLQAATDDFRRGMGGKLLPDEVLNVWLQLVTRRRGLSEWYLSSSGKPGHSSTIFQTASGDGAIYETARVLNSFRTTLSNIPGLTLNPSIILGGQTVNEDTQQNTGSASGQKTIIAAQTLVHGDLRFLSDKQKCMAEQKMHEIMETSLPLTSSQLIFNNIMPAMLEKNENRQLLAELSDISVTLGGSSLQAVQTTERGGADISYIAQYAAASLDGLGPWGRGTHSQNETLEVKSLPEVTKRAAIFISRHLD
ncbi:hypothetical protein EWM60_05180, partial [Candidatus Erwinia dacicola]|nr:hypothetical protein [Candidatus Erwinia dacicola]